MNIHEGRYLVCITRKNGDFYQYYLTDDVSEAVDKYFLWRDLGKNPLANSWSIKIATERGILNDYQRPHLYLIDLTATDDMITSGVVENIGQEYLRKFKRIKRLYQLNIHLI